MTVPQNLLFEASKTLEAAGVRTPRLDTEVLLSHVLGISREDMLLYNKPLTLKEKNRFLHCVLRRKNHEPIALITGHKEFWSLSFLVNDATLIPSPDSETLVEAVLKCANGRQNLRILDLGTGNGCLLLSVLFELKNAHGVGVDISEKALGCAKENAKKLGLSAYAQFQMFDWMGDKKMSLENFDIVMTNPPYVAICDKGSLSPEVTEFTPEQALYAGVTGYIHIERILFRIHEFLKPDGFVFMEIGHGQSEQVTQLFTQHGLTDIEMHKDLAGIIRVISGQAKRLKK